MNSTHASYFNKKLLEKAANGIIEHYHQTNELLHNELAFLCGLATEENCEVAQLGTQGLFRFLVERLSNNYDLESCLMYDKTFSNIINYCRYHELGQHLDYPLKQFGLVTEQDFISRKQLLRTQPSFHTNPTSQIKKCIVLSRVTLGAEIAVTSIVLQKLSEVFPNAELILISDPQNHLLFNSIPQVRIAHFIYPASERLITRLESWLEIIEIINNEVLHLNSDEYLILDPDSRLTQLGLLPLIKNDTSYLFFESRSYRKRGLTKISDLTSDWLLYHFGGPNFRPYLTISTSAQKYAQLVRTKLGKNNRLACVNLGTGGNESKRLSFETEYEILKEFITVEGALILLFKGVEHNDRRRISNLFNAIKPQISDGKIIELVGRDDKMFQGNGNTRLVTWEGPLDIYCALIREADIHIGYDSSSQHIAGVFSVPTIELFVDSSSSLHNKRWRPWTDTQLVEINTFEFTSPKQLVKAIVRNFRFFMNETSEK